MTHYAGLDVSLKETAICIVDESGKVARRESVATEPEAIARFFVAAAESGLPVARMVHESGQLAIWLQRELKARGLPVVCIDARRASKALSARLNKSDRGDAEGLAQLARTGWFSPVHVRSEPAERLRALLGARELLMRQRVQLEGHARGVLKSFGVRLGKVAPGGERAGFRAALAAAAAGDPVLELVAGSLAQVHAALAAAEAALAAELVAIARSSSLAGRLMSVPGVGPLVALADHRRHRRSRPLPPRRRCRGLFRADVATLAVRGGRPVRAHLEMRRRPDARAGLFEAATCLIRRGRRFSPLKAWARRLAARKGLRKAAVAVARKLAVILFAIWRDATSFRWKAEATA